jgi:hypothetical protein
VADFERERVEIRKWSMVGYYSSHFNFKITAGRNLLSLQDGSKARDILDDKRKKRD